MSDENEAKRNDRNTQEISQDHVKKMSDENEVMGRTVEAEVGTLDLSESDGEGAETLGAAVVVYPSTDDFVLPPKVDISPRPAAEETPQEVAADVPEPVVEEGVGDELIIETPATEEEKVEEEEPVEEEPLDEVPADDPVEKGAGDEPIIETPATEEEVREIIVDMLKGVEEKEEEATVPIEESDVKGKEEVKKEAFLPTLMQMTVAHVKLPTMLEISRQTGVLIEVPCQRDRYSAYCANLHSVRGTIINLKGNRHQTREERIRERGDKRSQRVIHDFFESYYKTLDASDVVAPSDLQRNGILLRNSRRLLAAFA